MEDSKREIIHLPIARPIIKTKNPHNVRRPIFTSRFPQPISPSESRREVTQVFGFQPLNWFFGCIAWKSSPFFSDTSFIFFHASSIVMVVLCMVRQHSPLVRFNIPHTPCSFNSNISKANLFCKDLIFCKVSF